MKETTNSNRPEQLESSYSGHENLMLMHHARNYHRFLADTIQKYRGSAKNILDFGAGVGALADHVSRWATNLVCVEPDQKQLEVLQRKGFTAFSAIEDLEPESQDYIYTINVLEHISDDQQALCAIFKTLRPNGYVLIYVPAFNWLYSSMDEAVGHVRRYSRSELSQKLLDAGFNIEKIRYVDSLGIPATILYMLMGNKSGRINARALRVYDRLLFPASCILDRVLSTIGGKNLLVVAEKRK